MEELYLRDVTAEGGDSRKLWDWRNDPTSRKMSLSGAIISWQEHLTWFEASLQNPSCHLKIAQIRNEKRESFDVGVGRVDCKPMEKQDCQAAWISLNIAPEYRFRGYGQKLLRALIDLIFKKERVNFILAEIKLENSASRKLFEKLGFVCIQAKDPLLYCLARPS